MYNGGNQRAGACRVIAGSKRAVNGLKSASAEEAQSVFDQGRKT